MFCITNGPSACTVKLIKSSVFGNTFGSDMGLFGGLLGGELCRLLGISWLFYVQRLSMWIRWMGMMQYCSGVILKSRVYVITAPSFLKFHLF